MACAPGLMMPGLLGAISAMLLPSRWVWSRSIGVITATSASATLVASQVPPRPTSTTATSTGASAKAAYAIAVMISKKVIGTPSICCSSTRATYGLDLAPGGVETLVADRRAVDGDPLGHAHHVRRGEPAGPQPVGAQQRLDHGRRAALAVGAGQVDHRVRLLRVAEQFGQRLDPAEAGRHPVLGPASGQGGDDLGVGLVGRHSEPSLGIGASRLSNSARSVRWMSSVRMLSVEPDLGADVSSWRRSRQRAPCVTVL